MKGELMETVEMYEMRMELKRKMEEIGWTPHDYWNEEVKGREI